MDIKISASEIKKEAMGAKTSANRFWDLSKKTKPLTAEETQEALDCFEKLYDHVMVLAEKLHQEGQVSEFGKFFSAVGGSLVRAQTEMDRKSALYIEETRKHPHALPSTFQIPKVSANIKFALQNVKGSKVNLLFYSKHKQSEEKHEQSLKFDIVATPPPAEVINNIVKQTVKTGSLPSLSFISNPEDRKEILKVIIDSIKTPTRTLIEQNQDRVLIVENWEERKKIGDKPTNFFILFAKSKKSGGSDSEKIDIGAWHFSFKGEKPEFKIILNYYRPSRTGRPTAGTPNVYKAILKMCDEQERFLKRLR